MIPVVSSLATSLPTPIILNPWLESAAMKVFSVTQSAEESGVVTDPDVATGSVANDNYFVTQAGKLSTVSNVNLRTTGGAAAAIGVVDGAIEKISSMTA